MSPLLRRRFQRYETIADEDGQLHVCGCEPRVSAVGAWFPKWDGVSEEVPIIPKPQWTFEGSEHRWVVKHDLDQDGDPSCCLFSTGNVLQSHLAKTGRADVVPDCRKAWIECTGGRGGYAIDSALLYLQEKGFPIVGSTERIFVDEVWDIGGDIDAFASALQKAAFVVFGYYVPGGHAEAAIYLADASTVGVRNSWGLSFGEQGWHPVSLAKIAQGIPDFGAFGVRELKIRPADYSNIPDAK